MHFCDYKKSVVIVIFRFCLKINYEIIMDKNVILNCNVNLFLNDPQNRKKSAALE